MLISNIRPGLLVAVLGVALLILSISPFFEEYGQLYQSRSTQSIPEQGSSPWSRVVISHASTQTEPEVRQEVVPLDGGGAVLPSPSLQWPEKEICVIWYVQPDMDQFNHVMDYILGGIEGHYITLIHDEGGHQSKLCREHTLVVTYCSQEHLDSMVYSKAQEQGVRRLGLYCLADEDSALTAQVVSRADYVFHEFGTIEGAEHVMAVPLGPTNGFGGDLNPRLRWPPAPQRPRQCAFKGRPCSDERKALFTGPAALQEHCDIANTEGYKQGAHPHAFRAELLATSVCLCPKGASYEQFRLWESLESGCLPVTTDAPPMPAILGHSHPLPTLSPQQWMGGEGQEFGELIAAIDTYGGRREEAAAGERRREVEAWFNWYKGRTQQRAAQLLLSGSGVVGVKNGTAEGEGAQAVSVKRRSAGREGEGGGRVEEMKYRSLSSPQLGREDWLEAREGALAALPPGPAAVTTCLVYHTRQDLPEHSFIMDVVLRGLGRDTALVAYGSADFMGSAEFMGGQRGAHQCDASALVFEHTLDSSLIAYAAGQRPRRLVLLALRLEGQERENGVAAVAEKGLWPHVSGVLADAHSCSLLRPTLEGIKLGPEAGSLRTATSRRAATLNLNSAASMPLLLLPWGVRSGFGNAVSMQQAMRPAAARTHKCVRLKDADDATWGAKPSGSAPADGAWEEGCPVVDVRQLKRSSDGQPAASEPPHLRVLLLDTVYAILPSTSTSTSARGDTSLLWEALACGAIPVLSGERNAIADELLLAPGLPPSPLPLLNSELKDHIMGQSSPREEGGADVPDIGATQREVFTWGLTVKRWVQAQATMLLTVDA